MLINSVKNVSLLAAVIISTNIRGFKRYQDVWCRSRANLRFFDFDRNTNKASFLVRHTFLCLWTKTAVVAARLWNVWTIKFNLNNRLPENA